MTATATKNPTTTALAPADRADVLRSELAALASHLRECETEVLAKVLEYTAAGWHRSCDGYSGLRDWIMACFEFNQVQAGQIARIARLAKKFRSLTAAASAGRARIDAVAYAVRQLDVTGLRVWATAPYPGGPQESPYEAAVSCATPEETIREHCVHASFAELKDAIAALIASRIEPDAILDELAQQTLQRLDLWRQDDGMWALDATLTADTGQLLSNYLTTAVPPPRQDEVDADGVLPAKSNLDAEALHQLLASAGAASDAPTRHGHTATVTVSVDWETLQGKDTGRVPRMDGEPISVAKARLLACDGAIIPMIFNYATGEVVELGKEVRLPNRALRRRLEAEQSSCAWHGCGRPVKWLEAHHIVHFADGGPTAADNLILLCRFHHGRIHTGDWDIQKTGPGQARITYLGGDPSDVQTDADWDSSQDDTPTGLFPDEYSPRYREQLNDFAAWYSAQATSAEISRLRSRLREKYTAEAKANAQTKTGSDAENGPAAESGTTSGSQPAPAGRGAKTRPAKPKPNGNRPGTRPAAIKPEHGPDYGPPPFLTRPQRRPAEGAHHIRALSPDSHTGPGPRSCPGPETGRIHTSSSRPETPATEVATETGETTGPPTPIHCNPPGGRDSHIRQSQDNRSDETR